MSTPRDYSVSALKDFLAQAESKGWIAQATASAMRSNVDRVFGVLDETEQRDAREIKLDAVINRFANLNTGVSGPSLQTYKSRISRAVQMFVDRVDSPTNWVPPSGRKVQGKAPKSPAAPTAKPPRGLGRAASESGSGRSESPSTHDASDTGARKGLSLPYPLRDNHTVTIENLPRDLTVAEAARLAAFLKSLAHDFDPGS